MGIRSSGEEIKEGVKFLKGWEGLGSRAEGNDFEENRSISFIFKMDIDTDRFGERLRERKESLRENK